MSDKKIYHYYLIICHLDTFVTLMSYFYFIFLIVSADGVDYCKLSCGNDHTLCKFKPCKPSHACGTEFKMYKLTNITRSFIVSEHNILRSIQAQSRLGYPAASNMRKMMYKEELEFLAQCWANRCTYKRDYCNATPDFKYVGQNVYVNHKHMETYTDIQMIREGFKKWKLDMIDYSPKDILSYPYTSKWVSYTQLIWSESEYVGCGISVFGTFINKKFVVVCNYAPSGNIFNKAVYNPGSVCTKCPKGYFCSKESPGTLCVKNESAKDNWVAPFNIDSSKSAKISTLTYLYLVHITLWQLYSLINITKYIRFVVFFS